MAYTEKSTIDLNKQNTKKAIHIFLKKLIYIGYTIEDIEKMSHNLTSYLIISYLLEYGTNDQVIIDAINNYYNNLRINRQNCLIISDTHIGKLLDTENPDDYLNPNFLYQNEQGLYNAYNYASQNKIKHIIHLGDLIEGDPVHKSVMNPKDQVKYFKKVYPVIDDIITYLLYGNHDYNAIRFDGINDTFSKACRNLKLIGVNYSFINFNGYAIKLSHRKSICKDIKHIQLPYDFELAGHRHVFTVNENTRYVSAPALALALQDNSMIGFLELINEENEFIFKYYNQDANYIEEKKLIKRHNSPK